MKIYGHRGAADLVAENTIESILEALNNNVKGVEIDVHCCKSGELVVIHDETLERTTNGTGLVSEYTLQELKQITTIEGYKIPTLQEVLEFIDGRCELNVELKGIHTALPTLKLLEEQILKTNWEYKHFIISSFDHSQLFELKEHTSKFKIGVLTEENISKVLPVAYDLEAFSIHPPISTLTQQAVDKAKTRGYRVYVWTVNTKTLIEQSKSWNVDAIITDFPNFV